MLIDQFYTSRKVKTDDLILGLNQRKITTLIELLTIRKRRKYLKNKSHVTFFIELKKDIEICRILKRHIQKALKIALNYPRT